MDSIINKIEALEFEVRYIDNQNDLVEVAELMHEIKEFSVDLEFNNNLHYYGVKICLLQLAFNNLVFLIDAKLLDISPLFKYFEDEKVKKNVFSFEEDLKILHSLGCKPRNIYDISTAVKLLNFDKISLADVVNHYLEISLEKGEQTSNWCLRPLSFSQLKYASGDVIYLAEIRRKVESEIEGREMTDWLDEENKAFENQLFSNNTDNTIQTKYQSKMDEVEWFLYQKLWNFRDQVAKEMDLPAFKVMGNELLLEIANKPSLVKYWANLKNMNPRLKKHEVHLIVNNIIGQAKVEIAEKNLSHTRPAKKPLERSEYLRIKEETRKADAIIDKYLKPVQELLKKDFGERAALFILSNRIMNELARGDKSNRRNYRDELINKYLQLLNMERTF